MSVKLLGPIDQSIQQGDDWHRDYRIKWLIETDDVFDGPFRAMNCPGLPSVGSQWRFGNDDDPIAFCWPNWTVSQFNSSNHEPNALWTVEQTFSTKFTMPQIERVENPMAEPARISGTFVKYQEEKRLDFEGKPMQTMSFEPLRGEMVRFDSNRPTVSIGMNYPSLGLNVFTFMIDYVNDSPMWGLSSRMVKLSNVRWTRNVYRFGYFYTRDYDFDVNFKTFDRVIPEVGTNKLLGQGPGETLGNKNNPKHWVVRKDLEGNVLRNDFYYTVDGRDWDGMNPQTIAKRQLKYYPQTNFFILGIPASF